MPGTSSNPGAVIGDVANPQPPIPPRRRTVRRVARGTTTKTLARVRPLEIVQRRRGAEKITVGGGGGRRRLRRLRGRRSLILLHVILHVILVLLLHHLHLLLRGRSRLLLRRFGRDPAADPRGCVGGSGGVGAARRADAHLRVRVRRFASEEGEKIGVARERRFESLRRRRGFGDADDGADGRLDGRRRVGARGGERSEGVIRVSLRRPHRHRGTTHLDRVRRPAHLPRSAEARERRVRGTVRHAERLHRLHPFALGPGSIHVLG